MSEQQVRADCGEEWIVMQVEADSGRAREDSGRKREASGEEGRRQRGRIDERTQQAWIVGDSERREWAATRTCKRMSSKRVESGSEQQSGR